MPEQCCLDVAPCEDELVAAGERVGRFDLHR
jgi:hypothetical protein